MAGAPAAMLVHQLTFGIYGIVTRCKEQRSLLLWCALPAQYFLLLDFTKVREQTFILFKKLWLRLFFSSKLNPTSSNTDAMQLCSSHPSWPEPRCVHFEVRTMCPSLTLLLSFTWPPSKSSPTSQCSLFSLPSFSPSNALSQGFSYFKAHKSPRELVRIQILIQ